VHACTRSMPGLSVCNCNRTEVQKYIEIVLNAQVAHCDNWLFAV